MSRARVGAYTAWQLRDYLKDRGLSTLVVAALSAYLGWSMMTEKTPMPRSTDAVSAELLVRFGSAGAVYAARMAEFSFHFMRSMLGAMIFLGALFAMNGIVANDRKQGFFRFLFAKPMTPSRYYGQAFVVHTVGFMLVMLLLGAIYGFVVTFNLFYLSFFMTGGGPFGRTELFVTEAYKLVNDFQLYGVAAAFSVILFFLLLGITLVTNRLARATASYAE